MRIAFRPLAGPLRDIPTPGDGALCAIVPGVECPGCKGAYSDGALRVHGPEMREVDDRFYRAKALCFDCGQHSRKPVCVHEWIERAFRGPYLEMFARVERPGWTCRGNEIATPTPHPHAPDAGRTGGGAT